MKILDAYKPGITSVTISAIDLSVGVVERVLVVEDNGEIMAKSLKVNSLGDRVLVEDSDYQVFPIDDETLPPFEYIVETVLCKGDPEEAAEMAEILADNLRKFGFQYVSKGKEQKLPIDVFIAVALRMALSDNEED